MEYLMWSSDGVLSSHLTFVLVIYNHKVRNQLHKIWNVWLNIEDINPYTTLDNLKVLWSNNNDFKKLQNKWVTFASKVRGT